ncbi:MAG: tetratricopeptide repeat protein [Chitinophaga sp.]|uniref:ATP-binding protein n=1 Tax=Chitinophaga sp. TaxID=1869181 RepID=UPI001B1E2088|nr:ATP-binding protein [Chitinophaga sp.]MBO9730512.1 tetratricopeptide repeat protein [Chitinophaga sp.]
MVWIRHAGLYCLLFFSQALCAQHNDIIAIKHALSGITDSTRYVDALNRLSALYIPRQLDSSGSYAKAANDIASRIHYDNGHREAMRGLGRYYALRPHRYLSFLFYENALTACRAAGDSTGVAISLMNLGTYYQYAGDHATAQHYLNRALNVSWKSGLDSLRAWVLVNYYLVNAADTAALQYARKALKQAVALTHKYQDQLGMLYVQLFEAHEFLRAGEIKQAENKLLKVISAADSAGLNYIAMYASAQLTGYRIWQQKADSLHYQQQSVNYAVAGGYTGLVLPVVTTLYNWYDHRKDADRAAHYSRIALHIMQQQQDDMLAGEADYLAYAFGDELKDSLEMQHHTQQEQLEDARSMNYFWYYQVLIITAIAVLLGILLVYYIRAYRLSRVNQARMAGLQEEIRKGNKALQDNDDFKNKLISMIAHDFRTPLHNIVNITGFIDDQALTVPEAADMILEVEKTATTTLSVFEEILRWIRTQLSGFVYHPEALLLTDMIDATTRSLQHLITEKKLQLVIDIPRETTVLADFEMLQFIHRNFLHNAIKFSPVKGTITIKAIRKNGRLTVLFMDEGPGIDAMVLPSLFAWSNTAYEQERSGKGAGLALIICKDFMDKMNGEINAYNNEQRGSTFYYQLLEFIDRGRN